MATQLSDKAERQIADRVAAGKSPDSRTVVDEALSALDWFEKRKAYERAWLDEKLASAVEAADRGDEWLRAEDFEARMDARLKSRGGIAA
ncbi:hypothetical protein [Glacieibacterium frigidum]|uniref:Uncharacterized protein n=1 Tax=Glacieibacterium frigidum TaxID=2593303 RepID=A0A552U7J7_9SPHN|nr:hypothetical protein [Glacieibacterium frigidum]TRW14191.1 hypothetical protein FMM06_10740 [Glacieibacterium frigidum]